MRLLFIAALALGATPCLAATTSQSAAQIVKAYSRTVACQLEDTSYRAVQIAPDDPEVGLGAMFVVHWTGDVGCAGGNGTATDNFTVVEHRGFASAAPIVVSDYEFPALQLAAVTKFAAEKGGIRIEGLAYGPKDSQARPTKRVVYRVKFNGTSFVKY